MGLETVIESGLAPDFALRIGIRRLLAQRLRDAAKRGGTETFVASLGASPLAVHTHAANEQHYELPTEFYSLCLGKRLKYSSAYYPDGVSTLDAAEEAMLSLYVERAQLRDGQRVLELGCGWGSLSLWMAERFPGSHIVGVSNSRTQREWIEARRRERGLANLEIRTRDVNDLGPDAFGGERFERIVSVEMFEHLRNWEELGRRLAAWLAPGGKLFAHVFTHVKHAYPFEVDGEDNWLGRRFFTGGMMPSHELMPRCFRELRLEEEWKVSGEHYARTAEHWLANLDRNREPALEVLRRTYGRGRERAWLENWRVFFMACAELWSYRGGAEWIVSHYRFEHAPRGAAVTA
jgi:cyclopropane-fatty-acyl-phospholipid synthase